MGVGLLRLIGRASLREFEWVPWTWLMGRCVSIVLDNRVFLNSGLAVYMLFVRLTSIDYTLYHLGILILGPFFLCIRQPFSLLLQYLVLHVSLNDMVDLVLL